MDLHDSENKTPANSPSQITEPQVLSSLQPSRTSFVAIISFLLIVSGVMLIIFPPAVGLSIPDVETYFLLLGGAILISGGVVFLMRLLVVLAPATSTPVTLPSPSEDNDDINLAIQQLSKNYEILRAQTTQGFLIAGAFMAVGLVIIAVGTFGELFGFSAKGFNLSTVAGIVTEFISGIGLYLYNKNFDRLNLTSDNLLTTWKVLAGLRRADKLPDGDRSQAVISLLQQLTSSTDLRPR